MNLNQLDGVAPLRGVPQLEGQVLHLPAKVVPGKESAQSQNCCVDGWELTYIRILDFSKSETEGEPENFQVPVSEVNHEAPKSLPRPVDQ